MWRCLTLLVFCAHVGSFATAAEVPAYPVKPVRVIAPFAAGGGVDFAARLTAQKLSAALGQPIVVDNRPGAGGNIGTEIVAKAPADGYTLLVVSNSFTVNPSLYRKVPYDPIKDFEPVTLLTSYMLFVVGHPSFPARSIKALIALAKAKPGGLTYGSAGSGTTTHIAGELFTYMAGVKMTHVPYKGSAPSMTAVLSGEVTLSFASTTAVPYIRSGKLMLLGVTGAKRSPRFPGVPTVAESGLPGYEATGWNALFAPAQTPGVIVRRLSEAAGKGFKEPDALEMLDRQDLEQATGTPEALAALVRAEVTKWRKVIKAAGIEQL